MCSKHGDDACFMKCSSTPEKAANVAEPTQAGKRCYLRSIPAPQAERRVEGREVAVWQPYFVIMGVRGRSGNSRKENLYLSGKGQAVQGKRRMRKEVK